MSAKENIQALSDYLREHRYKVVEVEDNNMTVRYQMAYFNIIINDADPEFCGVIYDGAEKVEDDNGKEVILACLQLSRAHKVVKAYLEDDTVILAYEFRYNSVEMLCYQVEQALRSLISAKVNYRKLRE